MPPSQLNIELHEPPQHGWFLPPHWPPVVDEVEDVELVDEVELVDDEVEPDVEDEVQGQTVTAVPDP